MAIPYASELRDPINFKVLGHIGSGPYIIHYYYLQLKAELSEANGYDAIADDGSLENQNMEVAEFIKISNLQQGMFGFRGHNTYLTSD